jgi:aspartate/methionine/tyrosine aminotransferase
VRVLERSRSIVARNIAAATAFMDSHSHHVEWVPPRAGSVAFPRFISLDADGVSTRLAERESVLLLPGRIFGASPSHFRLGLGRSDFPVALNALAKVLGESAT